MSLHVKNVLLQAQQFIRQHPGTLSPVPTSLDQVREWLHHTVQEIVLYAQEGHTPFYREIPWRVAFLLFCVASACAWGLCDEQEAQFLLAQALEEIQWGITADMAYDLFQLWYDDACKGTPAEDIDRYVLVPRMHILLRRAVDAENA